MRISMTEAMITRSDSNILVDILRENQHYFPLYCGGTGQCGKCKIRVIEGELPITSADRAYFSEAELKEGYRLGCKAEITEHCVVEIPDVIQEQNFYVPSSMKEISSLNHTDNFSRSQSGANDWGIAIDIGSTTIAMVLVNLNNGNIYAEYTGINHQRSFGTDVMARIQAAINGKAAQLQLSIQEDLAMGLKFLLEKMSDREKEFLNTDDPIDGEASAAKSDTSSVLDRQSQLKMITLAGNTTMLHLLRGYDCTGLASYPFAPVSLDFEYLNVGELLGKAMGEVLASVSQTEVIIFPGMSAFVGADITAGIFGSELYQAEQPRLFLDIGTNAEMAIGCKGQLVVSSAAAGPAFEGGELSCGVGSIPGAIRDIKLQYGLVRYETIGKKPAVGICGTGMVSAMAELKQSPFMDNNGTLKGRYASAGVQVVPGKIVITQADIREFQKAKAAIRAGLDILMDLSHYNIEEIDELELAGGFGCQMNPKQAAIIGLIPEELSGRVRILDNAVIVGLIRYMKMRNQELYKAESIALIHQNAVLNSKKSLIDEKITQMTRGAMQISLANHLEFTKKFIEYSVF